MTNRPESLLTEHLRETRRQLRGIALTIWGGGFLAVMIGFALAWFFIQPAPPRTIMMATGPDDGAYHRLALRYQSFLKRQGVTLKLLSTAGSVENYRRLTESPEVNLAIVQGGTKPESLDKDAPLESLASLYFEPIWVFYRHENRFSDLRDLGGLRIAVGLPESGTESIAMTLLEENGINDDSETSLIHIGGQNAADQLQSGQIDAAFFVQSITSPLIRSLISDDGIRLLDFDRAEAYTRRHPFLTAVTLRRGVVDLERDLPPSDVDLIAPAANLIATESLHDALVPLLLRTATQIQQGDERLLEPGRMPSTEFIEFPLNQSAQIYFEDGPPFLQKYLPFWVASGISRGKILLLPAITLLLPLFRVAPPLYRWRIRSRIYRWYEILREIESDVRSHADGGRLKRHVQTLTQMQGDLDDLRSVPLSYMEEFYNLRLHVEFVERRVQKEIDRSQRPIPINASAQASAGASSPAAISSGKESFDESSGNDARDDARESKGDRQAANADARDQDPQRPGDAPSG